MNDDSPQTVRQATKSRNPGSYGYLRADGVPVAHPLFQAGGGGSIPTSALQLRFDRIDAQTALELNALWHSVLPSLSKHVLDHWGGKERSCYVAEYDGGFYATAIWSRPPALNRMRWEDGEVLELRRMAIADVAPKNTASRMLAWMAKDLRRRFPRLEVLLSYQAEAHHEGTIYKAAGWKAGQRTKFQPWAPREGRRGNAGAAPTQTESDKVRWELQLREPSAKDAS